MLRSRWAPPLRCWTTPMDPPPHVLRPKIPCDQSFSNVSSKMHSNFWKFLGISGTKFCCISFPFDEDHGPNLTTIRPACNRKCRASRSSLCLVVAHCARRTPQGRGKIRQQRLTLLEYWALTATRCVYTSNMHINTNQPILYISIHLSSSVYLFTVSLFMCMCWCLYVKCFSQYSIPAFVVA